MKKLLAGSITLLCIVLFFVFLKHEPKIAFGPSLPSGKVEPQLIASWDTAFLLAPDGSLWTWTGNNRAVGSWMSGISSETPVKLKFGFGWRKLAGNAFGSVIALKTNGTLWGFGDNFNGQLGLQQKGVFVRPVQIGTDSDWSDISIGAGHSIAIKRDGSIWAWGQNDSGQVGDGTTANQFSPVRININGNWKSIAAGDFNGYAINSNGTVWGWGLDFVKGAGGTNALTPVQIDPATNWSRIWASDYVLFGLKTDGTLWIRGQNANWAASGYLNRAATNFVQLGKDSDWDGLVGGPNAFFAHKKDGSWWACGQNVDSEVGFHQQDPVLHFERVPFLLDPWTFSAGGKCALLLAKDGTLWTWGERIGSDAPPQPFKMLANGLFSAVHVGWRFPTQLHKIDHTPHMLWQLPPEVRNNLGTNPPEQAASK